MPSKIFPGLLGIAYLLTFIAGGHGAAFLIQSLNSGPEHFSQVNFLHAVFFLFVLACFVQRQAGLYLLYFAGAFSIAIANPLIGFPSIYFPATIISQIPLILVGLRFFYLSYRYINKEGLSFQFSIDDLLKTIVFAGFVAIAFKFCYVK